MSRSDWAWTESCVLVRVAVRVAGGLGTAPSFTPRRWLVAAVVLVVALGPAVSPAIAADGAHGRPSAIQVPNKQSRGSDATRAAAHGSNNPSRARKLPVRGAVARLLAFGSGYRTPDGLGAVRVCSGAWLVWALRPVRSTGATAP